MIILKEKDHLKIHIPIKKMESKLIDKSNFL